MKKKGYKYILNTFLSKDYWHYILFSKDSFSSILSIFGIIYLFIESLDFFNIYTRDEYVPYFFIIVFFISVIISILIKHPIKSIKINVKNKNFIIEVKIADLLESKSGIVVISTNSKFEVDVDKGKIDINSIQGQFTSKYFAGNQNILQEMINNYVKNNSIQIPAPMGTVIPILAHGKLFYFTVMSNLNDKGNSYSSLDSINDALKGLWQYSKECGKFQEIVLPVIGTGIGRVQISRKKMINIIAESFYKASSESKISEKLVIVIRPKDAQDFCVNLYDIKDSLIHSIL
ncbi:MAG: macro domain-containing protein [Pleomorphochaeta sp.]